MNLHQTASNSSPPSPGGEPTSDSVRRRLEAIEKELTDLFLEFYRERQSSTGLEGTPGELKVQLSLTIHPGSRPSGRRHGSGSGQLHDQLKEAACRAVDRTAAYPQGHVYCHWCRSFTCVHSTPPEPRAVFAGYSATGQPVWVEYSSVLLDRGDPRIELLFASEPAPVPLLQSGDELASKQLAVYGKRSSIYRILGQVLLGYLSPAAGGAAGNSHFAVTFQAVEAGSQQPGAQLNVLGRLADGTPVAQLIGELFEPRLHDALMTARRRLAEIHLPRTSRRRRGREKSRRALEVLRHLSRNLERISRQSGRRTKHSRDRHRHRGRPASVALRDALGIARDALYRDVEERTWVVLGPKNRVHVFNDQALHITSVVYPGETVRQRTTRGKWRRPREKEAELFLEALRLRTTGTT